jgi:hypothetical protein
MNLGEKLGFNDGDVVGLPDGCCVGLYDGEIVGTMNELGGKVGIPVGSETSI